MLRDRKVLVHPALGRAIAQAEREMFDVLDTTWQNWQSQLADLNERLDRANQELQTLRMLAAEARCPNDVTVH